MRRPGPLARILQPILFGSARARGTEPTLSKSWKQGLRDLGKLVVESVREWSADEAPRLAAGLAYYTVFAIAPLLVIATAIAGMAFGREAAQGEIVAQIDGLLGREGAVFVEELVEGASRKGSGILATILGLGALFVAVTGVFEHLLFALNTIWEVPPTTERSGIWNMVRRKFLSLTMVFTVGFLLLVSLLVSAGLAALSRVWSGFLPGSEAMVQTANTAVSLVVITGLFALMYKYLPETDVKWNDVWLGASVTALLFTIGKTLIGIYLGRSAVGSSFGAAGSLVLILLWTYYSAQVFFLGAEFTEVYARHHGSRAGKQKPPGDALVHDPRTGFEGGSPGAPGRGPFGQPAPAPAAPSTATGGALSRLLSLGSLLLLGALLGLRHQRRG